ncbi:MAG TPA: EAL domain-containing protein [Edaphobacter sp.]|jgi:diguanylate cyclase (GGDEF)-like protein/PAS domain S-box-containing protein|nr:EAL domain-containing protein [Edaphobacter sp.]
MTELIQRYRHAGSGIVVTSATLIGLVGCIALFLQSRLGALHYPGVALTNKLTAHLAFERIIWVAWFALGISLLLLVYECRKDKLIRWVVGAFLVFLIADLVDREIIVRTLSAQYPWIARLCATIGSLAATAFVGGLPLCVRRLALIVRDTTRARDNELRLITAAESSADSVILYDSVFDDKREICDFKFIFLNGNAERMIGMHRDEVLGKNLYEVFPSIRSEDIFQRHKRVALTGEPAVIETTSTAFPSGDQPARHQIQVVQLSNGIATTITDVTARHRHKEDLTRALNFNKSIIASSPFSIIVTDKAGKITSINPAAEKMLGYQESDLLGHEGIELHDEEELRQRALDLSVQFDTEVEPDHHVFRVGPEKGIIDEREWTYIRKDGSRIPVQLVVTALRDSDEHITGFVGISYDLTERKRAEEYIYHVAHHDHLTALPTRTLLRDRLEVAIERATRSQDKLAVLMVDLDNFKRVNDSLGHQAGDTVLCEISKRLKAGVRKSDTVGRMGGDEFVVLLPDLRAEKDAEEICQKLLASVAQPIRIGKHEIIVTCSIGISLFPICEDVDSLFKNADFAMYRVKNTGRNGSQVYTPGIAMQGLQQLQMESALRTALEDQEFEILYQPQISFADGRILGVESLLRWNSSEFGLVGPNVFIPLAEETGLIVSIGEWVLLQSCKEIAALQRRLGTEFTVAINISPRQFQQRDFPATVEQALQLSGLKPEQLELEITEHLLMVDSEESLEIMQRVRKLGVRFSIDDFGTGFSNMGYITRFAVDRLKIDRSFISRCDVDENSRAVTAAIIALAHSLQIEVIAEGVETEGHVQTLRQMACDQAQGYFYSRPIKLIDLQSFSLQNLHEHPQMLTEARKPATNVLALSAVPSMAQA